MSTTMHTRVEGDRRRWLVHACTARREGVALSGSDGESVLLGSRANVAAADRLAGALRRVGRVEIAIDRNGRTRAVVDAVGHRLPVRQRVPVAVGLGLTRRGVPTWVEQHPAEVR